MATFDGAAAVSKAIIGLLEDARSTFPHAQDLKFRLFLISDFEEPNNVEGAFTLPCISLCLYRVALNTSMRNAPRQLRADGQTYRAPLPLDLYYLLTPWAKGAEMQQRLLGWAMRVLHDTPLLPAAQINDYSHDVADGVFRPDETVELTLDILNFQDMTTIWDKLKHKMQTSATYIARMVLIESTSQLTDVEPMQTRIFDRFPRNGSAR